ncbi:MAG TPA: hypothetical protein PKL08_07975 [Thermoanaerobaculaceae bacterium]|nr:hypothetical protein [Thermoanaerobaculaceae bacterium]
MTFHEQLDLAAVQEDVEPAIGLSRLAAHGPGPGHAVDELQGDSLLACRRKGIPSKRGCRDDGGVPARRRHPVRTDRRGRFRLGGGERQGGAGHEAGEQVQGGNELGWHGAHLAWV